MTTCEIKFDSNPQGIFYNGQVLSGVVIINNEKLRKINGINLKIEGFAKCEWSELIGAGTTQSIIVYWDREDFLEGTNSSFRLLDNYEASPIELVQGQQRFKFSYQLPTQLPTSFESKYGSIRYQIKVELERSWKFDIKFCFPFTVIKVLDLNIEAPTSKNPFKIEDSKSFFLGLSSKTIHISAEMPMSGFVSGQKVPVSIKVNNMSRVDVEETKVSIRKMIHYKVKKPFKNTRDRIETAAEVSHPGIKSKSKANIEAQLIIPPLAPTNVGYCRVVRVSYEIQVLVKIGGIHRSICLKMPITIGTVPFSGGQGSMSVASNNDLPPPSYQEAIQGTTEKPDKEEGSTDEKPFSPLYPVFYIETENYQQISNSAKPPAYEFAEKNYNEKHGL